MHRFPINPTLIIKHFYTSAEFYFIKRPMRAFQFGNKNNEWHMIYTGKLSLGSPSTYVSNILLSTLNGMELHSIPSVLPISQ